MTGFFLAMTLLWFWVLVIAACKTGTPLNRLCTEVFNALCRPLRWLFEPTPRSWGKVDPGWDRKSLSGSALNFEHARRTFANGGDPDPQARYIADLEHDANEYVPAVVPLGKYPDHCARCKTEAELREREAERHRLQAICPHPEDRQLEVELRTFGDPVAIELRWCEACGTEVT